MKTADVRFVSRRVQGAEMPEERIIQRVVAGETNLYGILADRYGHRIYRMVYRIVDDPMDAEDIVQEAHMRALTYLHQFGGRSRFATWLARVAANEAFRQLRRRNRMEGFLNGMISGSGTIPIFTTAPRGPESCVIVREAREVLRRALAELPQRYRTVFLLREVEHATTAEVAKRLRIRCENVRLRLHRARRMLRKSIGSYPQ